MSLLSKFKNDPLFAKVIRSSGSLFSNNTISMGLSVVQSIMATRLLGPAGYGLLGLVIAFPATVNSIFSFRMNEVIVRYGGDYLNKQEKGKAAALLKAATFSGEGDCATAASAALASPLPNSFSPASLMNDISPIALLLGGGSERAL